MFICSKHICSPRVVNASAHGVPHAPLLNNSISAVDTRVGYGTNNRESTSHAVCRGRSQSGAADVHERTSESGSSSYPGGPSFAGSGSAVCLQLEQRRCPRARMRSATAAETLTMAIPPKTAQTTSEMPMNFAQTADATQRPLSYILMPLNHHTLTDCLDTTPCCYHISTIVIQLTDNSSHCGTNHR